MANKWCNIPTRTLEDIHRNEANCLELFSEVVPMFPFESINEQLENFRAYLMPANSSSRYGPGGVYPPFSTKASCTQDILIGNDQVHVQFFITRGIVTALFSYQAEFRAFKFDHDRGWYKDRNYHHLHSRDLY